MLHWRNRLRQRQSIRQVYRRGNHQATAHFQLSLLKQTKPGPTKIAIVISTKIAKKATVRNKLRRQVRGALAEMLPSLAPGQDIVITITKVQLAKLSPQALKQELAEALSQS